LFYWRYVIFSGLNQSELPALTVGMVVLAGYNKKALNGSSGGSEK